MSLKLVFAVVILSLAAAETCRKFECKDLDSNVCVVVVDTNTIQINDNPGDCICWLTLYRTLLAPYDSYPDNAELSATCPSESEDDEDNSDDSSGDSSTTSTACALNSNKSLASGSYPKACSSSTDCELADGTYGVCTCSSLGTYYCKPNISDPNVFQSAHDRYCVNGVFTNVSQQIVDLFEDMEVDRDQVSCYDKLYDEALWKAVGGDSDALDKYSDGSDFGHMLAVVGLFAFAF